MISLGELLRKKYLETRQNIMKNVINIVIENLKTEMTNVAAKGKDFGYICVDNEIFELWDFRSYIKTNVGKIKYNKNGWWNWWGWKKKEPMEYIIKWILYEVRTKDIFKGIKIESCISSGNGFIVFFL